MNDVNRRIKVVLALPHNHGGMAKKPGELIEVTHNQKEWLGWRGIIKPEQDMQDEQADD
jgi:hypothetical protein